MTSKVAAFTIVELLVSMLIASIILALAWNVFFFVGDYKTLIEQKSVNAVSIKKVEAWLKSDLTYCQNMTMDKGKLIVFSFQDTVTYQYSDNSISRQKGVLSDSVLFGMTISDSTSLGVIEICLRAFPIAKYCFNITPQESSEALITFE